MSNRPWAFPLSVFAMILLAVGAWSAPAQAAEPAELIYGLELRPFSASEKANGLVKTPTLLGDRYEYWADDRSGQFYLVLPAPADEKADLAGYSLRLDLAADPAPANGQPLASSSRDKLTSLKARFLVATSSLPVGKYTLTAQLLGPDGKAQGAPLTFAFSRSVKSNPVVAFPADGLPITLPAQDLVGDGAWPTQAAVPLPINAVTDVARLALFADGKQVPAQVRTRATWGPDGSPQWLHVYFTGQYRKGKAADYRLKLLDQPAAAVAGGLSVSQDDEKITVDNGLVRFQVSRKAFAGIDMAWFDATGKGQYRLDEPVIQGAGGPYLVDGRIIRFDSRFDKTATVEIEEQGPGRVTLLASGWYVNPENRVEPLCQFRTRITTAAGSPLVGISQQTIITYDTRLYRLCDVGFSIALPQAKEVSFGLDGKTVTGPIPGGPTGSAFLHQETFDRCRVVGLGKADGSGGRSDGWASVAAGDTQVTLLLRDVWQKFPKELEAGGNNLTVHFWPAHGRRAFKFEDELAPANIYKFWCWHQSGLLDLNLPPDYFDALNANPETFECRPEHALNGNGQGMVISNDLALSFASRAGAEAIPELGDDLAAESGESDLKLAQLLQLNPVGRCSPAWNAASGALGAMAAVQNDDLAGADQAFEQGMLSYTHNVQRGNEYGMWIYADTHTYWKADKDYASLHRVWHNSHYHETGWSWLQLYRSANPELLQWARANTDHYMNIGAINYANPEQRLKYHMAGGMYHCKGCTTWGAEALGMARRDTHSGLWGHWVDPDAFLWCWYLDANPRGRDLYEIWHAGITAQGLPLSGTRREANTALAVAVTLYQATWDADLLPAIHGLGLSLRTAERLEDQNPGPFWHPLWVNRYFGLTRDPRYLELILTYGRYVGFKDTWMMALSALAYDLSGDKTYLTQHMANLHHLPRTMYHHEGDAYDWYGSGPGPIGARWGEFAWPYFRLRLQQAGIGKIDAAAADEGVYACTSSRFDVPNYLPSVAVYALEEKDEEFYLHFQARSFGGDLHAIQLRIFSPSGKDLLTKEIRDPGRSSLSFEQPLAKDGESGLYRLEMRMHEAGISQPLTNLPHEALAIAAGRPYRVTSTNSYIQPLTPAPFTLQLLPENNGSPVNFIIRDGQGKELAQGSLFKPRAHNQFQIELDPAKHPLPWQLDAVGACSFTLVPGGAAVAVSDPAAPSATILLAHDPGSLAPIAQRLGAAGKK